ncbi:hypothetical protein SAMN05518848_103207 [Paenibacillus sp. PDC88]|nr:hypothetical protein SAMN05518848_103207 [Paenibacillus sp. PDC88]
MYKSSNGVFILFNGTDHFANAIDKNAKSDGMAPSRIPRGHLNLLPSAMFLANARFYQVPGGNN